MDSSSAIKPRSVQLHPFVTIIMPVLNEAKFIGLSLGSVLAQDYPRDRMEILVADGMSLDGTRMAIERLQVANPHLKLISNPGKVAALALNLAVPQSRGEIIIRIDGHCEIPPDYVRRTVHHLRDTRIAGVGPSLETVRGQGASGAIALAMSSRFGVGNSAFRTTQGKTKLVDQIPFPAYRRTVFECAGLFDAAVGCNEDDEFNCRLRKLGLKLRQAADLRARYYPRTTLAPLARQFFRYGYWKVRVLQKHPRGMRLRHLAPATFVLALIMTSLLSPTLPAARSLLLLIVSSYLAASLGTSVWMGYNHGWRHIMFLPMTFAVLHVSYGLGFIAGLARFWKYFTSADSSAQDS